MGAERWIATTPLNQRVRLSEDGWTRKVLVSHPEFAVDPRYEDEVRKALENPDIILAGWAGESLAVRLSPIAPGKPKDVCVVYRDGQPEGFVITVFFTSRRDKLMRRKVLWPKQP